MPIQHAVLALLSAGPSHGYELKSAFEAAVGPQWGPMANARDRRSPCSSE